MSLLAAVLAGKAGTGSLRGGQPSSAAKPTEEGRWWHCVWQGSRRAASRATDAGSRASSKGTTDTGGGPGSSRAASKSSGVSSGAASSASTSASTAWSPDVAELKRMTRGRRLELDDLNLDATIGRGAFGHVRVVSLKGSESAPMALKILEKAQVLKMGQVRHLKDEMSILSRVEHPFIVSLVRTFHDSRCVYLLMEFVNGGELSSLIKSKHQLADYHAKFYAAQCTLALEYLHSMKVAYRDLKPRNVLIDCDGCLKVTDFGFAKVVEGRTFTVCGTPAYVAPEVIRAQGHGRGVDWWGLGILVFEMLQGSTPFAAGTVTGIYLRALAMKVDYPPHFQISAGDFIDRLLKDRTVRLGCRGQGAREVKSHGWFVDIDWQDIYDMEVPAPWVPAVSDARDSSFFRHYPESTECFDPEVSVQDEGHFNFLHPNTSSGNLISI